MSPARTPAITGKPHWAGEAEDHERDGEPGRVGPHAEQRVRRRGALRLEDGDERERPQHAEQREHAGGELTCELPALGPVDPPDTSLLASKGELAGCGDRAHGVAATLSVAAGSVSRPLRPVRR